MKKMDFIISGFNYRGRIMISINSRILILIFNQDSVQMVKKMKTCQVGDIDPMFFSQ